MADISAIKPTLPVLEMSSMKDKTAFEPRKPVLLEMIDLHISLGKIGDRASHNILDRLENEQRQLQVWTKEQINHMAAIANRTWIEHGWSTLKTMAECVVSVVSFAMGGYLLTQGSTVEGNSLITFGIFNILQTVFARQGMWDWIAQTLAEKNESYRDRIKMAFPIIVSMLGMGFTIAGSKLTNNFHPNSLLEALKTAQSAISIGGQGVGGYFKIQKGLSDARLPEIQGELGKHQQNTEILSRFLESLFKENRRIKSLIKKTASQLMQATTLAAQKV